LAALAFLGLGQDVDVEAGQLRGEAHVLAAPADRQRQLFVGHHHLDLAALFVDHDLRDFGRLKGVHEEGCLILVPRDDVDLFALQLVDDRLHARAPHADAGADRVDRVVIGNDADLGAAAGVAGHGLDLDDAVVDFRHFHLEQFRHELRVGAAQEDLGPTRLATDILDIGADAVIGAIAFAADLLVAAQDRLAASDIDDDIAVFLALDHAVDDRALAVLELL